MLKSSKEIFNVTQSLQEFAMSRSQQFTQIQPITVNSVRLAILTNHRNFIANLTNNQSFLRLQPIPAVPRARIYVTM